MNKINEETIKEDGLNIHIIPSQKFKTINLVAKLKASLDRETITKRALFPYLLRQGTKNYPSQQELQLKLNQLYGAVLSIDGAKKGNNHIISIRLEVANQKYITNESTIIDESIDLLNEIIFRPNVENGQFNSSIFNREKETLKQKIAAVIDDKMAYANMRLIDEMCEGEAYGLRVHGYEEDLDSMTAKNSYDYYQTLLMEDQLDLYILGDFNVEDMKATITSSMQKVNEKKVTKNDKQINHENQKNKLKEVTEKQHIQQAKLQFGYRTNSTYKNDDYAALQVFNGLFGGLPSSKLFINVREKNSLAYYAASRIESHKGLLIVFSGIASHDYKQAREIIELQMAEMQKGNFTNVELEQTKELIVSQLLETLDSAQGMIELMYHQALANTQKSPQELIEQVKQVTREDVIQIGTKIEEDTIYFLADNEGDQIDE